MSGFKKFVLQGNLVQLAVAVVIGIAFGLVIAALVKDLITPLIAAIGGKPNFANLTFTVHHSKFYYGDFVNAVLSFIIVAAAVYFFVVLPVSKLMNRIQGNKEATERDCPECTSKIPVAASRCMFCTTQVTPTAA
jgi:large conductance mechanosensitive channel